MAGYTQEIKVLFCLLPGDEAITTAEGRATWPPPPGSSYPQHWAAHPEIAAQCCAASNTPNAGASNFSDAPHGNSSMPDPGNCRRRATPEGLASDTDEDCVAGASHARVSLPTFKAMTYGDTVAKCEALGLGLCNQSCVYQGCYYNMHPVYSGLPCPLP